MDFVTTCGIKLKINMSSLLRNCLLVDYFITLNTIIRLKIPIQYSNVLATILKLEMIKEQ